MAAKTVKENIAEATQETKTEVKKAETYKIIGKGYKDKIEANKAIREAHKKGFRNTGLCVRGNEFVLLFGTYDTTQTARANLDAIKEAGFTDTKIEH